MGRRSRWLPTALALVIAAGVLTACSSSGSSSDAPRRGGTLRVATVGLTTLDPAQADDPTEVAVAEMLFTPLIELDPVTHEPRPGLAARWHVDDAQKVFTFTLRPGLKFSDGTPITAADVKATLDRIAAKATQSPLAPLLELVAGYAEAHDAGTAPGLSGVVATNKTTVTITLTAPFSALPSALAHPGLGVVEAAKVAGLADQPVGSGPFEYASRSGTTIGLTRVGSGAGSPNLARISLVGFTTVADAQKAFDDHTVDLVRLSREDPDARGKGSRLDRAPYLALGFYAIDLSNPKFADARFRQAIVQAVDAKALVTSAYPGGSVSTGLVPLGVPGGGADQCRKLCAYDPAASKALLAAVFPAGTPVTAIAIDYDDTPAQKSLATTLVQQLTAVGIPATSRPHPEADYANFLVNGDPEVFRFGIVGDFPSEDPFLSPWFISTARENVAHVSSPAVDQGVTTARATENPARRQRAYTGAAAAVLATFAVAPVVQFETRLVATPQVQGLEIDPLGGFNAARLWIAAPSS